VDEPLAEPPGRLRPITPSADRQVGPLALPPALAVAFSVAVPLPVALRFSVPLPRRLVGECLGRLDRLAGDPGTAFLPAASPAAVAARFPSPSSLALPVAIARSDFRLVSHRRMTMIILRFDVRDVEEAVAPHREVDERRLDGRLDVDDLALVNIARVALVTRSLHVQLLENAVLDDGDAAFFGLEHIDQHFFLHAVSFRDLRREIGVDVRSKIKRQP
jgi:hypothetical protein